MDSHTTALPDAFSELEHEIRLRNLSIAGWQGWNETVFGKQNRKSYSEPWRIVFRITSYLGLVHEAIRVGNTFSLPYNLCMGLSWTLALVNNLGMIDLEKESWKRFSGGCPSCGHTPCDEGCQAEAGTILPSGIILTGSCPNSFFHFQRMLAKIYPHNTSLGEAGHLLEKLAKVAQALDHWTGTHEEQMFKRIVKEIVDVIAHMCGVASCNSIDLSENMARIFAGGCRRCHKQICGCEFTTDVAPPIRK